MNKGKIFAALTAIAVGIAAIIPVIAHYLFAALGWIFTMIGTGFTLLAAWFAKVSDEPHEKAIWGGILLFLTFAMIYYLGLPLLQYWLLLVIVAVIFGVAVLNIKWKEKRKRRKKK
jgi:O-antigen/teichoic acid export membrane protein